MTLDEYLVWTDSFAVYPGVGLNGPRERVYLGLGLCGEVGELCDKLKKQLRDGTPNLEGVKAELGDILWYWVRLCRSSHFTPTFLSTVVPVNVTSAFEYESAIHLAQAAGEATELISNDPLHPHIMPALARVYSAWAYLCDWLGFKEDEVLLANVVKLESRKQRGRLQGSGDNR